MPRNHWPENKMIDCISLRHCMWSERSSLERILIIATSFLFILTIILIICVSVLGGKLSSKMADDMATTIGESKSTPESQSTEIKSSSEVATTNSATTTNTESESTETTTESKSIETTTESNK